MLPYLEIKMSQKSASPLASLKLLPEETAVKVVLILCGHTSHFNLWEMMEFAGEHEIIMIYLPIPVTYYLQPLKGQQRDSKFN